MIPEKTDVRKPIARRLLALPLILAVFVFGAQAVSHSHGLSHDEDHCTCQVCHVGHVAIPQPASQVQIKAPQVTERFAPAETWSLSPESPDIVSIPRAPPALA
jgi:hypothetical protein